MGFDWNKAEQSGGGDPLPDGIHKATISAIKCRQSAKGEPQVIVTFKSHEGECDSFYTLTEKAAWTMAKLLARVGVDLEKMGSEGIQPVHLSNQSVAESYLLNKEVFVKVYTLDGSNPKNCDKNGNPYKRVEPLHKAEAEKIDRERVELISLPF
jgi:hypothetical protein